jgi:Deacetylase PdaC/Protein of unknown function (DUF3298)
MKTAMKTAILVIAVAMSFCACKNESKPAAPAPTAPATQTTPDLAGNYLLLKGTIGDLPITMHLIESDLDSNDNTSQYKGYYYYDKNEQPIAIFGQMSGSGMIELMESTHNDAANRIEINMGSSSALLGTWESADKKRKLPLKLLPKQESYIHLEVKQYSDSLRFWPQATVSPNANYRLEFLQTSTSNDVGSFLNSEIIKGIFGDSISQRYAGSDIKQVFEKERDVFFQSFKKDMHENAPDTTDKESMFMWQQELDGSMEVFYNEPPYLSMGYQTYQYMGGAHGSTNLTLASYNTVSKKKLLLADVFKPGFEKSVNAAIATAIRKHYGLRPKAPLNEVLFENTVAYNENFLITRKGILFIYNQYEIAAYAMGQIPAFVPFESVKAYVQPGLIDN